MKNTNGKIKSIDRFNRDSNSDFYSKFQEIMIQRMHLNYTGKYHPDNVDRIVRNVINRPSKAINTKIGEGFRLSCVVEPELYLMVQDTLKKINGNYGPIDELIHLLLTYFCYIYNDKKPKKLLPFKHILKGKSRLKMVKFQKQFGGFYKNTVKSFNE